MTSDRNYPHVAALGAELAPLLNVSWRPGTYGPCNVSTIGRSPMSRMLWTSIACETPRGSAQTRSFGGTHWGRHWLVPSLIPPVECTVVSYGLSNEVSFEEELLRLGCAGVGLDPTVKQPKALNGTAIRFEQKGAPLLTGTPLKNQGKDPSMKASGSSGFKWTAISPVSAYRSIRLPDVDKDGKRTLILSADRRKLDILKMDCEGCEYAIASHVLREDPFFFRQVQQFNLEAHVDSNNLMTDAHLAGFEQLLELLHEAHLRLVHAEFGVCGAGKHMCLPSLLALGYPCSMTCQNLLFARLHEDTSGNG